MAISKLSTTASLKEVMDKFEEISLQDFSSIDIITASELPVNVKEGQLCILKPNFTGHIYLSKEMDSNMQNGDILIHINNDIAGSKEFPIKNSAVNINLFIKNVRIIENGELKPLTAYLGKNNNWELVEPLKCTVFNNGKFDSGVGGMDYTVISAGYINFTSHTIGNYITLRQGSYLAREGSNKLTTSNPIDLSIYDYLHIDLEASSDTVSESDVSSLKSQIDVLNSSKKVVATYSPRYSYVSTGVNGQFKSNRHTAKIDIRHINEPGYINIQGSFTLKGSLSYSAHVNVYSLILGGETLE